MANAVVLNSPGAFTGTPIFLGDLIHLDAAFAKESGGIVTVDDLQSNITWSPVDLVHSPTINTSEGDPFLEFNGAAPQGFKRAAWNALYQRDGISGYTALRVARNQPTSVANFLESTDGVSTNTNSNRAARVRLNGTNMQLQLDFGPSASVVTISVPAVFDDWMVLDWGYSVAANMAYLAVNGTEVTASLGGQGPFASAGDKPLTLFYRDDGSTTTLPQSMTAGLKLLSCFGKCHAAGLRDKYRGQLLDRYSR